jgi:hypothetical protein
VYLRVRSDIGSVPRFEQRDCHVVQVVVLAISSGVSSPRAWLRSTVIAIEHGNSEPKLCDPVLRELLRNVGLDRLGGRHIGSGTVPIALISTVFVIVLALTLI